MSLRDIYETGFDESTGNTISADCCPECSGLLVTDAGETSCDDCGLLLSEQRLDTRPEWRSFEDGEPSQARTGAPLTPARHDRGLSSEIGFGHRDVNGNVLSGRKRGQLARLRREHTRARFNTTIEQNLALACSEIQRIAGALELSKSICEEASVIYRKAQRDDLIRGRSIDAIAAGSVYAACRCRGHVRSIEEIARVAQCSRQGVELGYRVLNTELKLETRLVRSRSRLPQLASDCEVADAVRRRAREFVTLAEAEGIENGRNPSGVAAACLYAASEKQGAGLTQYDLAQSAGVSVPTVRARYYELQALLSETGET